MVLTENHAYCKLTSTVIEVEYANKIST